VASAEFDFCVLGPLLVRQDDRALSVTRGKQRALLAALLLNPGRKMPLIDLAELLWDGEPPPSAPVTVQNYVMRLRKALGDAGGARISTLPGGYRLQLHDAELDVSRFTALLTSAQDAARAGEWDKVGAGTSAALALWRGDPLEDVDCALLKLREVPRLAELRAQALDTRIEADLHRGRHTSVIVELRDLIGREPLREHRHTLLMLALYRCGRQAEALAAYREARRTLATELGIDPGGELRRLHERILAGDASLTAPPAAAEMARTAPVQAVLVPRQLPASTRSFVGRQAEAGRLDGLVRKAADTAGDGTVVISAIDGMAGVGKTALAIHVAHRLAGEFPDGQLFIDMYGYTQGHEPRPAGEALEVFLRALGVPPQRIPPGTDERAAMFRQRLAGTRTMIVLDNAVSEAQVRPLVPGSDGCLVLVTSRRRLKGLDEALILTLDVLPRADALRLFLAVASPGRVRPDDPALPEIVELCAQLPLALRIAAALLRHRPAWTPEYLTRLLRTQQTRISALSDGERDLGAIFDLSYHSLPGSEQLMFRCLGLIPGPDFDACVTAALTGTSPAAAERLLEDLVDHNLVIEHVPGRYRLHDLIRLHARALADRDPVPARDAALERLMDYYQHTADRADTLISPIPRLTPAGPGPAHAPALPDADTARTWLRAERPNLLAALRYATGHGQRERGIMLTAGLATLLRDDGPWAEALAFHTDAIAAARSLGDHAGQAAALIQLGIIRNLTGDCPRALDDLERAARLYRELGDPLGQANALTQLGDIRGFVDDWPGAVDDLEQALGLCQQLGNRLGQANALARLGNIRRYTGDYPGAIPGLEEALRLYQQLGDRTGQAKMLISLGNAQRVTGDFAGAGRSLEEALRLNGHLDHQLGRANSLSELGELRRLTGDLPAAARYLEQGLQIFQDLGNRMGQANAQVWLGSVRQATGDLAGATQLLEAAVDTFRRIGSQGSEAWALNRYAAMISATGDLTHAENLYREALRLAQETGQSDDEAHALEGGGECQLRQGDTKAGAALLKQALEIFQRLAMQLDADRVQIRLAILTNPPKPASPPLNR
jgi:DNA-binding SARP family transcriptional activator/tetratricopeptide (TPR) repeat protein